MSKAPVGEGFDELGRILDRVMLRTNDAMSILTGTLGTQGSMISTLQEELLRMTQINAALHSRIGELQKFHREDEQLKAEFDIRRAELALKEKKTDAAISTATQVAGAILREIAARRMAALPPAGAPSAAATPGKRPLEAVVTEFWLRLSEETQGRIQEEAGEALVLEILQRLQGEQTEISAHE